MGGLVPIADSSVTLYEAGPAGGNATALATTTSDSNGNFSIGLATAPPPTATLYLVAIGGTTGGGHNGAILLMSIIGPVTGTAVTATINELTTVAAAYAASGFINNEINLANTALAPIANAAALAIALVNPATGELGSVFSNPNVNSGTLAAQIYALGSALSNCVQSLATSAACRNLFLDTTGSDTMAAIIGINQSPQTNANQILSLAAGGPFPQTLSGPISDWTLSLSYSGGGLNNPAGVAVDTRGNIWIANQGNNSVTELAPSGAPISPAGGFTGGGLDAPLGIAVDGAGNIWAANMSNNSVTELNSSGVAVSPAGGFTGGGLSTPQSVAIDASNNVWVSNSNNSVSVLAASGSPVGSAFTGGGLNAPMGLAIDALGNTWVANCGAGCGGSGSGSVTAITAHSMVIGFTGGGFDSPESIAIDGLGDIWAANNGDNSVTELNVTGTPISPAGGFVLHGLNQPIGIAIDGANDAWVANAGIGVTEVGVSPASGFLGSGGLSNLYGIAIDGAGDVWVTSHATGSVTVSELIGAAAPTRTPLRSRIAAGT
jgi:NHL repeat-containing protein